MTPDHIIKKARSWLGTPFQHQGRLPNVVLDCAGLIICLAREAGFKAQDVKGYSREPDGKSLRNELDAQMVKVTDWKPADVLLMKYRRDPRHLALYTGKSIIHAENVIGCVVEHSIDDKHIREILQAYRFRELT